jgi:hypothetical protein
MTVCTLGAPGGSGNLKRLQPFTSGSQPVYRARVASVGPAPKAAQPVWLALRFPVGHLDGADVRSVRRPQARSCSAIQSALSERHRQARLVARAIFDRYAQEWLLIGTGKRPHPKFSERDAPCKRGGKSNSSDGPPHTAEFQQATAGTRHTDRPTVDERLAVRNPALNGCPERPRPCAIAGWTKAAIKATRAVKCFQS